MSPILVRPVREQLEHDRVIRLLQVRLKRRGEVQTNIGEDQKFPVRIGQVMIYPDLLLLAGDRSHKLMGTVEVETAESVNHLEAMAQWAHLGRARAPFHLYVPAGSVDIARRLAAENGVNFAEIWSFHTIGNQTRFTLAHRSPTAETRRLGSRAGGRGETVEGECPKKRRPGASENGGPQGGRAPARQGQGRQARRPAEGGRQDPEKEVSPAVTAFQPRQTGVRKHVRRARGPSSREDPFADSLLVPHAAGREGRPERARRGGHPPHRGAQP